MKQFIKAISKSVLAALTLALVLSALACEKQEESTQSGKKTRPVPVEVADIRQGAITLFRNFNGTLETQAELMVAPKISGRVVKLPFNLADTVTRGQVVAELDNDEYVQAVAQSRAELAVAKANLVESTSTLKMAKRDFERVNTLTTRGVASDSQLDSATATLATRQAQLDVATAQVTRAQALLETANIKLAYTKVKAEWSNGDEQRVVAERYIDEGHTVSANAPLMRIVELNPIIGVIFVTEKDYALLQPGQAAELSTDAYPGVFFEGCIDRISPIFQQETRQARVELMIHNPELKLKPGMFIHATVEFETMTDAAIVPDSALTSRKDQTGVFVVNNEPMTVSWRPIKIGIRQGNRVQIMGEGLTNRVVSLGHQLIEDGSAILITNGAPTKTSP